MNISKNIRLIDTSLYLEQERLLIISDIHLGYEEALNARGVLLPRFQYQETKKKMESILSQVQPEKILINGDLKHEFGSIMSTEWKNTLDFLDFLKAHCKELIIVKGNHDVILEPVTKKKNIHLVEYYTIGEYFITHGDKIIENLDSINATTIIIGNEHPAISLQKNTRKELYKCFLFGTYKNKQLIVIPSFNVLIEGSDILREQRLSPYIPQDLSDFHVYIVGDEIYDFGTVKDVEKLSQ